jgi:hypothetical protein
MPDARLQSRNSVRRGLRTIRDFPPRGWLDAGFQFLLFYAIYNVYGLVRGIADGRADVAFANAHHVMTIERGLGAFFEPGFQDAVMQHHWLVQIANFLYLNSHFVITTGFLAWLYLYRNENFYFVRNMFMVAMCLALVGYALFPTAPPRLIPEAGFHDTISAFTGVAQDSQTADALINKYAAVPSMHICFSLMVAVPVMALARYSWVRILASAYPLTVLFAIITTGNHFWFDAVVGAMVACLAAASAKALARVRPERWSWQEEPGEASPA